MSDDNTPEALAEVCRHAFNTSIGGDGACAQVWRDVSEQAKNQWRHVAFHALSWCRANRGPEMAAGGGARLTDANAMAFLAREAYAQWRAAMPGSVEHFDNLGQDWRIAWAAVGKWLLARERLLTGGPVITPRHHAVYPPLQPFDVSAATAALSKLTDAMDSLPREDKGKAKEALAHAMATVADSIRIFYTTSHTVKPA